MNWRRVLAPRGEPKYLVLGPAGSGKTTLIDAAMRASGSGDDRRSSSDSERVAWNSVGGAVMVEVPGSVAFPADPEAVNSWQRFLRRLYRRRPRRPLDGIILALPASLILDPAREDERVHLSAAIRERFALAQGILGFTVPVYVVITKADEIPGFEAFTGTLSGEQQRNMLGWSNPHDRDEPFSAAWVNEGIESLHDAVVRAQVERFASSTHLEGSGDLFLFSGALRDMATPLRELLDEVFRPSLYREAFYYRGFYLSGRLAGSTELAFAADLLVEKVFAERGLATPLSDAAELRSSSRRTAQIVGAVLIVGLGLTMYWGYTRLRRGQAELVNLLTRSDEILFERRRAAASGRPISAAYRLDQSRRLLEEQLRPLNDDRLSWIVYRLNPLLRGTLTRIFRDIVLEDFRVALEDRGRRWLHAAQGVADDPAPSGPNFKDRARYRMLAQFAQEYGPFVENYERYDELRRVDGNGTFASLGALSEYLDGTRLTMQALGRPYASALRSAGAAPITCSIFEDPTSRESLVAIEASALLDEFLGWSFADRNPVRAAALAFTNDWTETTRGQGTADDLERLIDDASSLSAAATAWTSLGTAPTVQPIALFDRTPFTASPADAGVCRALLWPDFGPRLQEVERLKDALKSQLLALAVEPFGPIMTDTPRGLLLSDDIVAFKKDLDALQMQPFWSRSRQGPDRAQTLPALPRSPTWRGEDIDAAVKTADAFDNYRGPAFDTVDSPARDALLDVVEAEVSDLVATHLQRTATPRSNSSSDSSTVLDELKVTASLMTKLSRLAPLLSRSSSGQIVLAAVDSQAAAAIAAIDLEASRNYPAFFAWPRRAATFDGLFGRWQQIRRTAAAADAPKLWEAVADDQRDAGPRFAALATPFANYLVERRKLSDATLRWARIGRDVGSYEKKLPDNGLSALDALVRTGIPAMLPANNCLAGSTATAHASGEYFAALRDELAREGERQCHARIQRDYATLVSAFDAHLKDKFPFVSSSMGSFVSRLNEMQGRPEATLDDVKALLDTYRSVDGPLMTGFLGSRGTCTGDPALAFLRSVNDASTLLGTAADPQLNAPMIALDLRPRFRVGINRRSGGDQIAEWRLDVGPRTLREPVAAAPEPLPWTFGDRVSLVVRFARDSPSVPASNAGLPLRRPGEDDRTVRFDFAGNWAIFRLLLAQTGSSVTDALIRRDAVPTVLGFDIPVQPDVTKPPLNQPVGTSTFDLYMELGFFPRGKTEMIRAGTLPTQGPPSISCLAM